MARRGIIIANTGSPGAPTPEAVRGYLRQFLTDPRICPMHPLLWKAILNACILPRRSVRSAERYRRIWMEEGSPLTVRMTRLANALQKALSEDGRASDAQDGQPEDAQGAHAAAPALEGAIPLVRAAMSYGEPSLPSALRELREAGCDELTVVPLYPQSAHSTTLVVADALAAALDAMGWAPAVRLVKGYCDRPAYVDVLARSVRQAGFERGRDRLLVAFHSVPMRDIAAGDTYDEQAHATAWALARALGLDEASWRIGFQCRFDKSRTWLGPTTAEVLEGLDPSPGRLFVVAPIFSIDCLETLYDIDVELRGRFARMRPDAGEDAFRYVACLNDGPDHVALLRSIALEA